MFVLNAECLPGYKEVPSEINNNEFEFELPVSKTKVTFKLLTGKDERIIEEELKSLAKIGVGTTREITTRLKHVITSIDGETDKTKIRKFVDEEFLSRDSLSFRNHLTAATADVDMNYYFSCAECAHEKVMPIPMTVEFFWPAGVK